jgi:hypothetical protein
MIKMIWERGFSGYILNGRMLLSTARSFAVH